MTHIARVLALVLVIIFACASGLAACAPANEAVFASTPEPTLVATATPTPEPTPTPTPTPEPTPTPMPELTLEQKELLLGIGKNSAPNTAGRIVAFVYTLNDKRYRNWCYCITNEEKSSKSNGMRVYEMYDLFTGEYLFSVSLPNDDTYQDGQSYSIDQYINFLSETNPALNGMKLDCSGGLVEVAIYFSRQGIDYNNDPTLNNFAQPYIDMDFNKTKRVSNTVLSVDMQIQIFLNSTPQEEIMPYWVFTPGAQIPDELKGIYSEVDYPPAPAE